MRLHLRSVGFAIAVGLMTTSFAAADIVAIDGSQTNTSSCGSGSNVCLSGDNPFFLSDVLNGSTPLVIPPNGTPNFLVEDDLNGTQTSLTLVFTGSLASNASISCQVSGWSATTTPFDQSTCTVDGDKGTGPEGLTTPQTIVWTEGPGDVGLSKGEIFDVRTASFAHAGQDFGKLSGVPEPSNVAGYTLLVFGMAGFLRRQFGSAASN
jgi:hypothetical protein